MWSSLKNYSDAALLVFRIAFGVLFLRLYGWGLLVSGVAGWKAYAVGRMGITLIPAVAGFLAAMAESAGVALLIIGLAFRPSALALTFTFLLVSVHDFAQRGGSLVKAGHSIELMLVFFLLMFLGAGKFSIDKN